MLTILSLLVIWILFLCAPLYSSIMKWHLSSFILSLASILVMTFVYSPLTSPSWVSMSLSLDGLSSMLVLLSVWTTFLMILASKKYLSENKSSSFFITTCLLLLLTLLLTFSFSSFFSFYVTFEFSLLPTLVLILGWGYQPERLQAGYYFMMYTLSASLPLLVSLLTLYSLNNHLFMGFPLFFMGSPFLVKVWWIMTILAFLAKLPIYGLHLWLPKAHVEAPVSGSMVLASVLLKLGGYGLLRMTSVVVESTLWSLPFLTSLSLWGGLLASFVCLQQTDMKCIIAYSSVTHMALIIVGSLSNTSMGEWGSLGVMLSHGLTSSGLFALAGLNYDKLHSRSLFLQKGLLSIHPKMALLWFLLMSTNMSVPPSINLMSELIIIPSVMSLSSWVGPFIMFMVFMTAVYNLYLYAAPHHGAPSELSIPNKPYSSVDLSLPFLHIVPLYALILKPELILLV